MAHPDHDPVIGRLAGARLHGSAERRRGDATVEPHPDAETWAAYVDGGLLPDEVGSLETHLAGCSVCRRLVAALVPEVSTAVPPAVRSAEPPASGPATILPFPRRQVIAWMGIAAGLFGAVTLWSVSRLGSDAPVMDVAATTQPVSAPAPDAIAPPASAPNAAAPLRREAAAAERDARQAASAAAPASAPADMDKPKAAAAAGAGPAAADASPTRPAEEKRADAMAPAVSANARQIPLQTNAVAAGARPHGPHAVQANQQQNAASPLGTPVPAPTPPAPAAPAVAAPALADAGAAAARQRSSNEQAVGQVAEVVSTTGAAAARPAAARSERAQTAGAAGGDCSGAAASKDEAAKTLAFGGAAFTAAPSFAEPGGRLHWRIAEGRRLESSSDGGATWRPRYEVRRNGSRAGTAPALRAGTAPAIDSAWVVGERGLVLRFTVPGEWTVVTPPAAVTLIAVSATGAQSARVTAADGRVFETADGGATWTPATPGAGPQ